MQIGRIIFGPKSDFNIGMQFSKTDGKKLRIFLDLDGIIRDFVQGVIDKFSLNLSHKDINKWNWFEDNLNISDFWERLDNEFWLNLPKTPFADDILELVKPYNTVILTSPTLTSAGGTQDWIRKHLPEYFKNKRYLIGPAKWACANRNSLLIDDADHNVKDFKDHGGNAILFPAPWNAKRDIAFSCSYLKTMFFYYIGNSKVIS